MERREREGKCKIKEKGKEGKGRKMYNKGEWKGGKYTTKQNGKEENVQ